MFLKEAKPYTLIIDGALQGYYGSFRATLYALTMLSNTLKGKSVKIYHETATEQKLVHEE